MGNIRENARPGLRTFFSAATIALAASSCVDQYAFEAAKLSQGDALPPPNSSFCVEHPDAEACNRDPVVSTPGVVTVLFTVSQIPQGAASLILANAIKYASPQANPKILFLKDSATYGEDEGDSDYIKNTLLGGYAVDYKVIPAGGLAFAETDGKDLVIVSNPGHPLADRKTLDTLTAFQGGVILIGDDLSYGAGFSMDGFTGLKFKDNGTAVSCNGKTYAYDNLKGYNYQIEMNTEFLPGIPAEYKNYLYGNDIDVTTPSAGTQVLAWAKADPSTCDIGKFPAVVRRPR